MFTQILTGRVVRFRTADLDSIEGQGLVEYALILLLIAVASVASVTALGDATVGQLWSPIRNQLITVLSV